MPSMQDRIQTNVVIDDAGCWVWQRSKIPAGYGKISVNGRDLLAHRVAYEAFVGPIPDGLELDHLCRVRACCNPAHLEPVTRAENHRRALPFRTGYVPFNASETCPRGHSRAENTYVAPSGHRKCRPCNTLAVARRAARRKAVAA